MGRSTADAGSPKPTVHPVTGDRLQAENDGIPSSSVDRSAPSGAVRDGSAKSGLGLRPMKTDSDRVRAMTVMRASISATTPSRARPAAAQQAAEHRREDARAEDVGRLRLAHHGDTDRNEELVGCGVAPDGRHRGPLGLAHRPHPVVAHERGRLPEGTAVLTTTCAPGSTSRTACHAGRRSAIRSGGDVERAGDRWGRCGRAWRARRGR